MVLVGANGNDVVSGEAGSVLVGAVVGLVEREDEGKTMVMSLPQADSVTASGTGDFGGDPQPQFQPRGSTRITPSMQSAPPISPETPHLHGP